MSQERREVFAWRITGQTTSQWCGTDQSWTEDLPSPAMSLRSVMYLDRPGSRLATSTPTTLSSKQPTCLKVSSIRSEFTPSTRSDRASRPPNSTSRAKLKCHLVNHHANLSSKILIVSKIINRNVRLQGRNGNVGMFNCLSLHFQR